MKINESGIILFVENYEAALEFYTTKLGLTVRRQTTSLTIFNFGNSYLMIEDRGVASPVEKTRAQNPIIIRIDVQDFDQTVEELLKREVPVKVRRPEWGTIGIIIDPEGNRIEIKEGSTG
ncbi:VOC family protein [Paenibacillus sp. 1_12]|uniref:VOC family protein n=1 Tax=Paenibacillus sp. 1_12 TaxID=1566278 RepID=UPI0015A58AFE|nr:VOC family protein [Paenibacillus sp. 1_12]